VLDNQANNKKYAEELFYNRLAKPDEAQAVFLHQYCRSWKCDLIFFPGQPGEEFKNRVKSLLCLNIILKSHGKACYIND